MDRKQATELLAESLIKVGRRSWHQGFSKQEEFGMISIVILTLSFLVLVVQDAHAYLDPGTGSYILQVTIAFLAGASFAIKIFWKNIKIYLSNLFSKNKKHNQQNEENKK